MTFKEFQSKTNPRPQIAQPPKNTILKYLPHGFYIGQKVKYTGYMGRTVYGIVTERRESNYSYENNKTNVWAYWSNSLELAYMPASTVSPA